jgi:hypothetical protein
MGDEELISQWLRFCAGEGEYEPSHFQTLLMEVSPAEVAKVFSCWPQGPEISKRFGRFSRKPPLPSDWQQLASRLIRRDLLRKGEIVRQMGETELATKADTADLEFLDRRAYEHRKRKSTSWPDRQIFDIITDHVQGSWCLESRKMTCLEEACYRATNHYYLTWYILAPLSSMEYDFEHSAAMWEIDVAYFLSTEKAYACRIE